MHFKFDIRFSTGKQIYNNTGALKHMWIGLFRKIFPYRSVHWCEKAKTDFFFLFLLRFKEILIIGNYF